MAKTLYICYFGLRQPLVQTQVIPYLLEIMKRDAETGRRGGEEVGRTGERETGRKGDGEPIDSGNRLDITVALLTFEPDFRDEWTPGQIEVERGKLQEKGIEWHCLPYHKRPSAVATAYDIVRGAWFIRRAIGREEIDVLHGRVHVPTMMGALARKFSTRKPKLLFDIRGFFPEEYTDAGIWPENGVLFRLAKRVEKWLMKEADGFVVLTEKAKEILFPETPTTPSAAAAATPPQTGGELRTTTPVFVGLKNQKGSFDKSGRPVEVIPCCVDLRRFDAVDWDSRDRIRKKLGVEDRKVIAYVGSFGGWYLTDEMLEFFAAAREHDTTAFALILTQRDKEAVVQKLRDKGFADSDFLVETVPPSEIAMYLNASDLAISFIKSCYSKLSSSPTKIAEYLACGLPIIANPGVGDIDSLIEDNKVGVLTESFDREGYLKALEKITALGDVRERSRETARREFDLEKIGGERYRRLYGRLLERKP